MKIRKLGIILLATIITVTNMVVYANSADDSIIHSSDDVIKEDTKKTKRSIQKVRHRKQSPSRPKKINSSPRQLYLFHRKLRHRKLFHRKLRHQKQYRLK